MTSIPALPPTPYALSKTTETGNHPRLKSADWDFRALLNEHCEPCPSTVHVQSEAAVNELRQPDVRHANTCRNAYILGVPFECAVLASISALAPPASGLTWMSIEAVRKPKQPGEAPSSLKRKRARLDFSLFK